MTMWMILVWELLLKFKLLEIVDWNDDGDDDDDNDDALDDDDGKNGDVDDQMILGWVPDDVHTTDDQVEPS